ncbi:hypothetical protein FSARC_9107 [Fusarium sarcochroum]|uniref:Protein kinase domain-containing protein n=1 Tax=Fusarium sarcochroum TaxID=1208366 RepID=A0A8H4X6F6_9HYPO|nr:hypothetical protein FSARC_9107 [Fusarium sarcochroum]
MWGNAKLQRLAIYRFWAQSPSNFPSLQHPSKNTTCAVQNAFLTASASANDVWRLHEYDETEVPFTPEGNRPLIGGSAEKVSGTGMYAGIFARKTVWVDRTSGGYENSDWRDDIRRKLTRELNIIHHARHQHVVQFVHAYVDVEEGQNASLRFCYVMDRMDHNLRYYLIHDCGQTNKWYGCLLEAVHHIHRHGVRHGNMKPENILIRDNRLVLTDFDALQSRSRPTGPSRILPVSKEYRAPEVAAHRNCYPSADIFSLGCIFLEMIVADPGVQKYRELSKILHRNWLQESSFTLSVTETLAWIETIEVSGWQTKVLEKCKQMLSKDEKKRPVAQEILEDWKDELWACQCPKAPHGTTEYEQLVKACQSRSLEEITSLLTDLTYQVPPSALHYAVRNGSKHALDALLDRGVSIDERDPMGRTALHHAASSGSADLVKYLLSKGASTAAVDGNGQTALHWAARRRLPEMFTILELAGVPTDITDLDGRAALDILQAEGPTVVVDVKG